MRRAQPRAAQTANDKREPRSPFVILGRPTMFKRTLPAGAAVARALASLFLIAVAFPAATSFAAVHFELGDAGQTQGTVQNTGPAGSSGQGLSDIFGTLLSETDADLFLIRILNPATFSATTVNAGTNVFDTQLFLLTLSGAPVYLNDDANGLTTLSTLPAGNALGPVTPGLYLLGISAFGYDPVNSVNQLLFASGLSTDVRGPAPLLQPAFLGGFANNFGFPDGGGYDIQLTGALVVPEPGTAALMLLAGALLAVTAFKRRRVAEVAL